VRRKPAHEWSSKPAESVNGVDTSKRNVEISGRFRRGPRIDRHSTDGSTESTDRGRLDWDESSDEGRRIISTRSIKTTMKIATSMTIFLRSQNVISGLEYALGA